MNFRFRTSGLALLIVLSTAVAQTLTAGAPPPPPTPNLSLSFDPNPVIVGNAAEITAETTEDIASTTAKVEIQRNELAGVPVACGTAGSAFENLAQSASGVDSVTATQTHATTGNFGYRAHFIPGSSVFANTFTGCANLQVIEPVCSGLTLAVTKTSGPGEPVPNVNYNWSYTVTIRNCEATDLTNVFAQGGNNGWSTYAGASATPGTSIEERTKNKNTVVRWNIGTLAPNGTASLTINLTGKVKAGTPDCTVVGLTGAWSATSDELGKTDYELPIVLTVKSNDSVVCAP